MHLLDFFMTVFFSFMHRFRARWHFGFVATNLQVSSFPEMAIFVLVVSRNFAMSRNLVMFPRRECTSIKKFELVERKRTPGSVQNINIIILSLSSL